MIIELATIYAFFSLFLSMVTVTFYFAIFFLILYIAGWPMIMFMRTIGKMIGIL